MTKHAKIHSMQVDDIYLVLPGNQIPSRLSDLGASMKLILKQGNIDIRFVKYICSAHAVVYSSLITKRLHIEGLKSP